MSDSLFLVKKMSDLLKKHFSQRGKSKRAKEQMPQPGKNRLQSPNVGQKSNSVPKIDTKYKKNFKLIQFISLLGQQL